MKIMANYNNPYRSQQNKQAFGINIHRNFITRYWGLLNNEVPLRYVISNFSEENRKPLFDLLDINGIKLKQCYAEQSDLRAISSHSTLENSKNGESQPDTIRLFMTGIMLKKGIKIPE